MKISNLTSTAHLSTLIIAILWHGQSMAEPICTTAPDCEFFGSGGSIGGQIPINDLGTYDIDFTTLRFKSLNDYKIYVGSNATISHPPYKIWEHVFFGDPSLTQNIKVNFFGSVLTLDDLTLDGGRVRTVQTSQINLDHVDMDTDTVKLLFAGPDNQVNLNHSGIHFSSNQPGFISTSPLTINVLEGDNYFKNFSGQHVTTLTTINVHPGATLFFDYSGDISSSASAIDKLSFYSPVNGTVDYATLKLRYSNIYFNSNSFNFVNNSKLQLHGSETTVEFANAKFDGSSMSLGENTTFKSEDLTLSNVNVDLSSGAKIITSAAYLNGTTDLAGDHISNSKFTSDLLRLNNNAILNQSRSKIITEGFVSRPGSQLNINNGYFDVDHMIFGEGGTVNINNNSIFRINAGFPSNSRVMTFIIDGTSGLNVIKDFPISSYMVVNNDGDINVFGTLSGDGAIAGNGTIYVPETGQITPGDYYSNNSVGKINTLTIENSLKFTNRGSGTIPSRSQYLANIDVSGGVPQNDLLQYNNNNFDITDLSSIEVDVVRPLTADELNGMDFTIISSLNSGSVGTLVKGSDYPTIVESADIPALIDFVLFDNNSNGKPDVTLQAKKDFSNLLKHPSVSNSRNKVSGANLLINAATSSNNGNNGNASIITSLNNLTNSNLGAQVNSINPEPFSSYMTVSLEHSDMIINTVLNHADTDGYIKYGNEINDQKSHKRFWMDTSYIEGDVNGSSDLGDFKYSLSSLTIGHDLAASVDQTVGMYFSFGTQDMDEHDTAIQSFDGKVYHFGAYLKRANIGGWDIRGVLGYAYGDNMSERKVMLSNSTVTSSAEYESHSTYAGVRGAITGYENNWVTLSPELGLSYIYYTRESFKEYGDPNLSLALSSANAQAMISSAGINARFSDISKTMRIYPLAFVRYEHDFYANANNEHEIEAALLANPSYKQSFVGQNRGENAIVSGVGMGNDISSALKVNGGLVYSDNSHGHEWGAGLNMEYHW